MIITCCTRKAFKSREPYALFIASVRRSVRLKPNKRLDSILIATMIHSFSGLTKPAQSRSVLRVYPHRLQLVQEKSEYDIMVKPIERADITGR